MKIAITGHTSGVGLALKDYFESNGHLVIGFSRKSGYNIANAEHRQKIVAESVDCDIFVNNAYNNFDDSQLEMLKLIYNNWAEQDKLIFNMSSRITDFAVSEHFLTKTYQDTKRNLDIYCTGKVRDPQIVNLKLGAMDTPRLRLMQTPKMHVSNAVTVVDFVMKNRGNFKVSTITVGL